MLWLCIYGQPQWRPWNNRTGIRHVSPLLTFLCLQGRFLLNIVEQDSYWIECWMMLSSLHCQLSEVGHRTPVSFSRSYSALWMFGFAIPANSDSGYSSKFRFRETSCGNWNWIFPGRLFPPHVVPPHSGRDTSMITSNSWDCPRPHWPVLK